MKLKILLLTSLLNVFAYAFWGPLFSAYAVSLGASPKLAGTLFAFFAFSQAFSILFFGKFDNEKIRFRNVVVGYTIQGLCSFVFIYVSNPVLLFVPLFVTSAAGGMIAPAWKALYTNALTKNKEGAEWSYADAGTYFITAFGTLISGMLISPFGYKAIFVPLLIINLISTFILFQNRNLINS